METPNKSPDFVAQRMDDPPPTMGNGGPRRPGNLWTSAARDDMFKRRENGETWETICVDYPNRSRHAMQQQYSMMKKQRALAAGTWRVNKRGRKRKVSIGEKKPPVARKRKPWLDDDEAEGEETEEEDYADPYAEESEEELDESEIHGASNDSENPTIKLRPPLPMRSSTDPTTRMPKSKIVSFPIPHNPLTQQPPPPPQQQPPPATNDSPRATVNPEWNENGPPNTLPPIKRRRVATEPNERIDIMPAPAPIFVHRQGVMFSEDRLMQIINEGREIARSTVLNYEAEKTSQRQTFEASVSRANRRAHDAQEKLRNANLDHAETLKFREREHAEEKEKMKRSFFTEQTQRTKSYNQEIEALKGTIDNQIKEREELEKANSSLADEIDLAKKVISRFIKQKETEKETSHGEERKKADANGGTQEGGKDHVEKMEDEKDEKDADRTTGDKSVDANLLALKEYAQSAALQQVAIEEGAELQKSLAHAQAEAFETKKCVEEMAARLTSTESKLATAETQLELFDQLRLAISLSVKELRPPQEAVDHAVSKFVSSFSSLAASVMQFNARIDDISVKTIVQAAGGIKQEVEAAGSWLDALCQATQKASSAAQTLVMDYSEDAQEESSRPLNGTPVASGHNSTEGHHPPNSTYAGVEKSNVCGGRSPYMSGQSSYPPTNGYS